jgi:threonine dehydrogenase-like Zn-dependent dehydrogenase
MKTRAMRLYGKKELRLEEFDLPPINNEEILARVVTDSICLSNNKSSSQGPEHKRIPADVAKNHVITGYEFAGEIIEVGATWQHR